MARIPSTSTTIFTITPINGVRWWNLDVSLQALQEVFYAAEDVDERITTRANILGHLTRRHQEQSIPIKENTHRNEDPNGSKNHVCG
jgi:hypothetical protein